MRFEIEQRFSAPLIDVEAAFYDPALLEPIAALSPLGRPELLEQVENGPTVRRRIRYAFTGHLSGAARAVVDPHRLTWVEVSVLDRTTHRTEIEIVPDHYRDRLHCAATVTMHEQDGVTRRVTQGDLRVTVAFVGARVEHAIVAGLRKHAAAEEQVVQGWLDDRAAAGGP